MFTPPPMSPKPKGFLDRYREQNEQFTIPSMTSGREAAYAVGNRVYNGVSNSPHSGGGLDKSGYLERDQKARAMKNNSLQKYIQGKAK